jgi:hypothetical protein
MANNYSGANSPTSHDVENGDRKINFNRLNLSNGKFVVSKGEQ